MDAVTDVLVKPAYIPTQTDNGDTTRFGPTAWKAPRLFSAGADGQLVARDSLSATGASWVTPSVALLGLTYAVGDLLVASGPATLAKLADVAVGSVLVSGGIGGTPFWSPNPAVTSLLIGASPASVGDLRVRSGFSLKANNAAGNADGTILATDGLDKTVLGGQSVSVANNGVISLGATMNGFLVVQTINYSGMLAPRGAVHSVTIVSDPTGSFSIAAGTGGLVNVYWSAGNSRYELENKTGVTISATLLVLGVI